MKSCEDIKEQITIYLEFIRPDSKDFIIYSFESEDMIVRILMKSEDEGNEIPIAFMSKGLRDVEENIHHHQNSSLCPS